MPTEGLAIEIADEWAKQKGDIDISSMPITSLACTAIDRVLPDKSSIIGMLIDYAETDLLCYRVPNSQTLRVKQDETWQPLLDWAEKFFSAPLFVTEGVIPVKQPASSLAGFKNALVNYSEFELAALANLTQASGSLVAGLALLEHKITTAACIALSQMDEQHQIGRWGTECGLTKRLEQQALDIQIAAKFLSLLRK